MTADNPVRSRIETDVRANPVVLYMKGSPVFPQCGFSAQVVQVLSELGVKFQSYDVLSDDDLRQGIKEFSNWPTIPQLYVQGEFVGGCDIVREMYLSGELAQLLKDKGIETETAAA
jgi:monothiol glutaredoxin